MVILEKTLPTGHGPDKLPPISNGAPFTKEKFTIENAKKMLKSGRKELKKKHFTEAYSVFSRILSYETGYNLTGEKWNLIFGEAHLFCAKCLFRMGGEKNHDAGFMNFRLAKGRIAEKIEMFISGDERKEFSQILCKDAKSYWSGWLENVIPSRADLVWGEKEITVESAKNKMAEFEKVAKIENMMKGAEFYQNSLEFFDESSLSSQELGKVGDYFTIAAMNQPPGSSIDDRLDLFKFALDCYNHSLARANGIEERDEANQMIGAANFQIALFYSRLEGKGEEFGGQNDNVFSPYHKPIQFMEKAISKLNEANSPNNLKVKTADYLVKWLFSKGFHFCNMGEQKLGAYEELSKLGIEFDIDEKIFYKEIKKVIYSEIYDAFSRILDLYKSDLKSVNTLSRERINTTRRIIEAPVDKLDNNELSIAKNFYHFFHESCAALGKEKGNEHIEARKKEIERELNKRNTAKELKRRKV